MLLITLRPGVYEQLQALDNYTEMGSNVEKQAGSLQEFLLIITRTYCSVVKGKPMQYEGFLITQLMALCYQYALQSGLNLLVPNIGS